MKFILNKCKVIQLGKYNLTPWRLGERHLESSNTDGLRDSKLHWDLRYIMAGCGTGGCTHTAQAFLMRRKGGVSVFLLGVSLHVAVSLCHSALRWTVR